MAHERPNLLKKRHLKGSASRHHVEYKGQYLLESLRHGAILNNVAIKWIVMAFSVVNSAGNGWTDGIRRILVWVSKSVYFHIAVVAVHASSQLDITMTVSEAFDIEAYPNAKTSPLPLIARPTQSLIFKPMCLLRSRISVVPMDPAPRKTAFFACTHIKSP